mgnify:CR=1 FL=1
MWGVIVVRIFNEFQQYIKEELNDDFRNLKNSKLTNAYGNMDDISSISIHENDNINKQIIELVSKLINNYSSTTQDPAYLLFTGKTNDNS